MKAEEARRKREEETELVSESRSSLVRLESNVRCGQVRVTSEQGLEIADVIQESATQAISGENEANYVPKGHMMWWRRSWWVRFFEDGPHLVA